MEKIKMKFEVNIKVKLFIYLFAIVEVWGAVCFATTTQFNLKNSKITYEVNHPLHQVKGVSTSGKGKGQCDDKICDFLIGATVKSFDSENSNRDLHVLEVTRAALNPVVTMSLQPLANLVPSDLNQSRVFKTDAKINFAGILNTVQQVEIQIKKISDKEFVTTGKFKIDFDSFKMEKPSLLRVSVKNEILISFEAHWDQKNNSSKK